MALLIQKGAFKGYPTFLRAKQAEAGVIQAALIASLITSSKGCTQGFSDLFLRNFASTFWGWGARILKFRMLFMTGWNFTILVYHQDRCHKVI